MIPGRDRERDSDSDSDSAVTGKRENDNTWHDVLKGTDSEVEQW